jgi:Trk K+ transport system NAD-binding subunit
VLTVGFAALIAAGTIGLLLPAAAPPGRGLTPVQALFTATSAVCVTGLIVVDTANDLSIGENVESSVLVVMLVKDLGVKTVMAKAATPLHGRILEKPGVSRVIFPERDDYIALRRRLPGTDRETMRIVPAPDDRIEAGDVLIVLGRNERLANLDDLGGG